MIGTWVNVGTILVGAILGTLLGSRIPEKLKHTLISGIGLFILGFGLQLFIKTQNSLLCLGSLLIGALLGEWWRIEDGLQSIGIYLEKKFMPANGASGTESRFVRGFMAASLMFCIGPMAILGSIQDGLTGDYQTLVVKAILDGIASLAFASTMGIGVSFSALPLLIYQGGITLLASQLQSLISTDMVNEMSAVGGLIMMAIAISTLLELRKIRLGNYLPALIIAPLLVWLLTLFK